MRRKWLADQTGLPSAPLDTQAFEFVSLPPIEHRIESSRKYFLFMSSRTSPLVTLLSDASFDTLATESGISKVEAGLMMAVAVGWLKV